MAVQPSGVLHLLVGEHNTAVFLHFRIALLCPVNYKQAVNSGRQYNKTSILLVYIF
jgi:hypothetical protein